MNKWKVRPFRAVSVRAAVLVVALTAASLAQTSSGILTPEVKRVGMKLACLCGGCNNTVGNCPMIGCHYGSPSRDKIEAMQKTGADDKTIVDAFVAQDGLKALAAPPAEGFSLMGWLMPYIAVGFGLIAVILVLKRFRKPMPAGTPVVSNAVLDRYRDQIEKDSAKLE
jgi:cytochrome c-type biogenesis protein CcmH/NrfF